MVSLSARILLLLLVCALPAAAQEDQRAFLDVTINGEPKGDGLVLLRGDDALIAADMLIKAGAERIGGHRETVASVEFVSLASLAPDLTFVVDVRELTLAITAGPRLFPPTVRTLQAGEPANLVHRSAPSALLNYAISGSSRDDYDVFAESAMSARGVLFYNTVSMSPRGAVRGLTSATIDNRSALRRWVVGDAFAGGTTLGGNALLSGISVSRDFSLAPYYVHHPTLSLSTPIATPSTVEVHVNGRLVRQEQVQPGLLDLRDLPLSSGRNDTRIVVRDPFGGERELNTGYYLTTSALARGLQEYRYAFGWQRRDHTRSSWDYSAPALFARHRIGVNNWLSLGGRAEAERGLVNGGPIVNLRLPFGEIETAKSVSRAGGTLGNAGQMSFVYAGRLASVGTSARAQTATYRVVGAGLSGTREQELSVFGSVPMPGLSSLSLQHTRTVTGKSDLVERSSVSVSRRLIGPAQLTASTSRVVKERSARYEMSVGVTMGFGGRGVVSTGAVRTAEGTRAALDVQQSLPLGTGFGYQLHGETGTSDNSTGVLQYQNQYGRYEVRRDAIGGTGRTNVSVAGALVGIGGDVFATRPVRSSYALIRVPGVSNVRAYSSHQEIGRTDRHGNLLVPDLLPYYGNQLNIADSDIPLDFVVPQVEMTLAPPYRGGAVVMFPVRRVQRVVGRIQMLTPAGLVKPAFGELTVVASGEPNASPLGHEGEFYFENLPEGRHEASVTYEGESCAFVFEVPHSVETEMTLGTLQCAATAR